MPKKYNDKESRLIRGLNKVIQRQHSKSTRVIVGNRIFENKKYMPMWNEPENFYYPLLWQPLKYAIKPIAHTTYTYVVSKLPMAQMIVRRIKRKAEKKIKVN